MDTPARPTAQSHPAAYVLPVVRRPAADAPAAIGDLACDPPDAEADHCFERHPIGLVTRRQVRTAIEKIVDDTAAIP